MRTSSEGESPRKMSIKDFQLIKNLGKGSYARVVKAKHLTSNKIYAIKVIDKEFIEKEEKVHEVLIEKQILTSFDHPSIVKLRYTFQNTKKLYFVLELAEKGTLKQFLNYNRKRVLKLGILTPNMASYFAAEILVGLEYIHSRGFIHRDIKPENLLLEDTLHCDFSSATAIGKVFDMKEKRFKKILSQEDIPKNYFDLIGTAEYVSPEMLESKETFPSSDLWALGIIIFQFFHGKTPFVGSNQQETINNILQKKEIEMSSLVPEEASSLIEKLLQYDIKKRFSVDTEETMKKAYSEIKSHPFFRGIDFDNIMFQESPSNYENYSYKNNSDCSSPASNSFSSLVEETVDIPGQFSLDKSSDPNDYFNIENRLNIQPCKRLSEPFTRERKSLFFMKKSINSETNKETIDDSIYNQGIIIVISDNVSVSSENQLGNSSIKLFRNKIEILQSGEKIDSIPIRDSTIVKLFGLNTIFISIGSKQYSLKSENSLKCLFEKIKLVTDLYSRDSLYK